MKAVISDKYGSTDVLRVEETERPVPKDGEVLVKLAAAGVTTADWRIRASEFPWFSWLPARAMFGLFRPKHRIPGRDFAGRVVARGSGADGFQLGDAVFGVAAHGAHAEYVTVPADGPLAKMPAGMGFADAAALPFGALAALGFLRDIARLRSGERVLIAGATGGVGVFLIQLARRMGADVTALAGAEKRELALSLGATRVIDYRAEDFSRGTARYDAVIDAAGVTRWRDVRRVLAPGGRFVPLEFGLGDVARAATNALRRRKIRIGISGESAADLREIADLAACGDLSPVIDSSFPLSQIAAAHARVEQRHKTGAVILDIDVALPRARTA